MMFAELHQFKSTQTSQRVGEYNDNFQFEGLAVTSRLDTLQRIDQGR